MKYNLNNEIDRIEFKEYCSRLLYKRSNVELKATRVTRTQKQNRALHLLFTFIATELNDIGLEHQYFGVSGKVFSTRYTPHIVKEYFYRPIQIALFDIHSTTKTNTKQINEVVDVIVKFFADKGVVIEFPSVEGLINN